MPELKARSGKEAPFTAGERQAVQEDSESSGTQSRLPSQKTSKTRQRVAAREINVRTFAVWGDLPDH